ncbi:MAG: HAD-IC family P-type ATPase, partial [Bacteroidales bacterium]|nr:HAD-IC family P-type ATPase [Bacteroidales bacterium]
MGKNTDFSDHNFVGLTDDQVKERQLKNGFNELPKVKSGGFFQQIAGIFKEPMFMLLIICGTLYMVLGDTQEGFMLLGFVFFIMGIEFYQERKTGKALEALKELSTPNALVIRNGEESKISCRELVQGDLVIFSEGERVPADGIILHSINLQVDESLLTGESVPVRKIESDGTEKNAVAGGDG